MDSEVAVESPGTTKAAEAKVKFYLLRSFPRILSPPSQGSD